MMFIFIIAAIVTTIVCLRYLRRVNPNYNTQSIDLFAAFVLGIIAALIALAIEVCI